MSIALEESITAKPTHPWLREMHVAFTPGPMTPLLEEVMDGLKRHFHSLGHQVQTQPDDRTDAILTTAPFGEPLHWRESLTLFARRRFNLSRAPAVYTLVQVSPTRFQELLDHFDTLLAKRAARPSRLRFPWSGLQSLSRPL